MSKSTFQKFGDDEGLEREGNFKIDQIINGELSLIEIFDRVPGDPNPPFLKPPSKIKGKVKKINKDGDVTEIFILEISPISKEEDSIHKGYPLNLLGQSIESYYFYPEAKDNLK